MSIEPDFQPGAIAAAIFFLALAAFAIWALAWGVAYLMAWVVNWKRDHAAGDRKTP